MKLSWAQLSERFYETGIDRGVLFVEGQNGVSWSGITEVTESPSGGQAIPYYLDGIKFLNRAEQEEFAGSISAFYSPPEFDECDGSVEPNYGVSLKQQGRKSFSFSFRTKVINAENPAIQHYKIHIIYNAVALPADHSYVTLSADTDLEPLSWKIVTQPLPFPELLPTAHITIDTSKADPAIVDLIEDFLYGTTTTPSVLPSPSDVFDLFGGIAAYQLIVTDLGSGLFDISGPDDHVTLVATDTYTITGDGVTPFDAEVATISST